MLSIEHIDPKPKLLFRLLMFMRIKGNAYLSNISRLKWRRWVWMRSFRCRRRCRCSNLWRYTRTHAQRVRYIKSGWILLSVDPLILDVKICQKMKTALLCFKHDTFVWVKTFSSRPTKRRKANLVVKNYGITLLAGVVHHEFVKRERCVSREWERQREKESVREIWSSI